MNFDFGHREKAFQEKIRALFSDTRAEPLMGWGEESMSALRRESLTWLNRLAHTGYLSLALEDEPYGPATVAAQQLLAAVSPALYVCAETSARIFGRLMNAYGSPQLRSQVLPAIRHGEAMGAAALSEPGFHETRADMGTVGFTTSEGFRVSGEKPQVMNAPIADWIAVAGTVDNTDAAAFFLVSRHDQGLFMGQKSPPLGCEDLPMCAVTLEDCRVDPAYVMGPMDGREVFTEVRIWENQVLAAGALGLMQRALDTAVSHAKRHQSGGKPLIAYQEVGFKLAEMLTLLQTAQLLVYRAAWMWETGGPEAQELAYCAKVFSTESAEEVASKALHILGQTGFAHKNPAEGAYRNAKYLQVSGTASALSRMKIADGLLKNR
ncbi:MAG: acyl-CoA dehydrogenase [Desulfatiglandaceae bacterium]